MWDRPSPRLQRGQAGRGDLQRRGGGGGGGLPGEGQMGLPRGSRGRAALVGAAALALAAAAGGTRAPYDTAGAHDPDAPLNVHVVPHSHDDVGEDLF